MSIQTKIKKDVLDELQKQLAENQSLLDELYFICEQNESCEIEIDKDIFNKIQNTLLEEIQKTETTIKDLVIKICMIQFQIENENLIDELRKTLLKKQAFLSELYIYYDENFGGKNKFDPDQQSLTRKINVLEVEITELLIRISALEFLETQEEYINSLRNEIVKIVGTPVWPIKIFTCDSEDKQTPTYKTLNELQNDENKCFKIALNFYNDGLISEEEFDKFCENLRMVLEYNQSFLKGVELKKTLEKI